MARVLGIVGIKEISFSVDKKTTSMSFGVSRKLHYDFKIG